MDTQAVWVLSDKKAKAVFPKAFFQFGFYSAELQG
jgi:hypothetical protein